MFSDNIWSIKFEEIKDIKILNETVHEHQRRVSNT